VKSVFLHKGKPYSFQKLKQNWANNQPRIMSAIAEEAVNFFQSRFRAQAWTDRTAKKWKPRKHQDKNKRRRAILIKSGRLRNAIRPAKITKNEVVIANKTPYAPVHNEGFKGTVNVKQHTRKIRGRAAVQSIKTRRRSKVTTTVGTARVRSHRRKMNIPQRQFMGNSEYLFAKFDKIIYKTIDKTFDL
jgi:phage gpG-like protein